jgi:hypothetical protein
MMTVTKMLYARAGAAAIAAAMALSPTYAAPKPIVDLSQSPALSAQKPATETPAPKRKIGPFDEQTAEIGGGALAALIIGMGAVALSRRKRKRDQESWNFDSAETVAEDTSAPAGEPMTPTQEVAEPQPAMVAPHLSAFNWNKEQPCDQPVDDGSDRCPGETWVERAQRGPSPANPSASQKTRLRRAAFFDTRARDVAAGKAAPIDPDAGLPDRMVDEQEQAQT